MDFRQVAANGALEYQYNDELTFLSRMEWAHTREVALDAEFQRFMEFQTGIAYRPIEFDWINFLMQYKMLDDKSPDQQSDLSSLFRNIDELYQFDVAFDVTDKVTLVESFSRRDRQAITSTGRTDSNLYQWINRVEYDFHPQFELIGEYRLEGLHQSDEIEYGAMIQLDYKPLPFVRVGVGYDFRSYENNLTPTDEVKTNGVFFRVTGDASAIKQEHVQPVFNWLKNVESSWSNIKFPNLFQGHGNPQVEQESQPTPRREPSRRRSQDIDLSNGNRGYLIK
jgi:hypothetical protein